MTPHAIVVLPKTDGMEMLLCYEDEGVYVNTYGRITKDVVLQWGEMPTSVGASHPDICIRVRSVDLNGFSLSTLESLKHHRGTLMSHQS